MGSGGNFARIANSFIDEGLSGRWFGSGSGPITVAGGQAARFNVTNPLGSGKLILIHRYRIHVTTASEYVAVIVNATTNLPATVVPSLNRRVGSPTGVAQIRHDAGVVMTGGTALPYQIPIQVGSTTFTEFIIHPTIIVPPGASIGTNFANTTGGNSQVVSLLDWEEIPL
jgi:hypothetical protein